jgi:ribosomal protein S1
MELEMSDTTKLIAPPEELEAADQAAAPTAESAVIVDAGVEAKPAVQVEAAPEAKAASESEAAPEAQAAGEGDAAPSSALDALRRARDQRGTVDGRVFGWNPGGFHVVIDGLAAFVPRSEMELEPIADPEAYLDKTFAFRVLKIQGKGRRIVLSRTALLREEQEKQATATVAKLRVNDIVTGRVSSLTDFGAFVDVGGVEGLVHVSEISRQRINKPADALQVGQEVTVKVLKVEKGGRRLSLSIKALEPDPWREIKEKYPEGAVVTGKVERTDKPGAFIQLEPGLVGLLPTSEMGLPREAIPARAYPVGKEVKVQVVGIDPKRRRISLAPEGSRVEGTRGDYQAYLKQQRRDIEAAGGLGAMAAALSKLKGDRDQH